MGCGQRPRHILCSSGARPSPGATMPSPTTRRTLTALIATAAALSACTKESHSPDKGEANLAAQRAQTADTGSAASSASTPVAGGVAAVTPTDAKSVTRATEFRLTDDNFRHFIAASESLAV